MKNLNNLEGDYSPLWEVHAHEQYVREQNALLARVESLEKMPEVSLPPSILSKNAKRKLRRYGIRPLEMRIRESAELSSRKYRQASAYASAFASGRIVVPRIPLTGGMPEVTVLEYDLERKQRGYDRYDEKFYFKR